MLDHKKNDEGEKACDRNQENNCNRIGRSIIILPAVSDQVMLDKVGDNITLLELIFQDNDLIYFSLSGAMQLLFMACKPGYRWFNPLTYISPALRIC